MNSVSALAKRFPNEHFLIVQYGDHQPVATRTLLGFDKSFAAEDVKLAPDSRGFLTYYSIDGVNYAPPPLPDADVLDVPYLGTVMLAGRAIAVAGILPGATSPPGALRRALLHVLEIPRNPRVSSPADGFWPDRGALIFR